MRDAAARLMRSVTWTCVGATLVVGLATHAYVTAAAGRHRAAEERKLTTIADLEAERVAAWALERPAPDDADVAARVRAATERFGATLDRLPVPSATGVLQLALRDGPDALVVPAAPGDVRRLSPATGTPISRAAAGAEGIARTRDERGVPVVAALRSVPGTPWVVAAQLDEDELEAPNRELAATAVAVAASLVLAVCAAVVLAAHHRAAELRANESERRRGEERALAALLVANLHEPVVAFDMDLRVTAWNAAAERMYGWTAAEALGAPVHGVLPAVDHSVPQRLAIVERARRDGRCHTQLRYRRRDGSAVDVELTLVALHGPAGEVNGFVSAHRDVSAERRLQAQLAQAERMASLGTLAAGMAHALNSPLAGAIANVGFAQEELARPEADLHEAQQALDDAMAASRRAAEVVRSLQVFARAGVASHALVDLRDVARQAADLSARDVPEGARLALALEEPPLVRADRSQLTQVVLQLLANAFRAVSKARARPHVVLIAVRPADDGAVLEVSDTGCGMTEEVRSRIFEPFFTTDGVAGRSGLGLAMCHGTVSALAGSIEVESEEGRGSTFRVRLPADPLALESSRAEREADGEEPSVHAHVA